MHRRITAAVVAAITATGAGALTISAQSADADAPATQAAAKSQPEHFLVTTGPDGKQVVVAHGAFAGGGRDVSSGQKDVLHLGGGTVTLKHPNSESQFSQGPAHPKSCFVSLEGSGKYTLVNGTGRFEGVSGHGTFAYTGQAIAQRKGDGTCDTHSRPKAEAVYITASGPASSN